MYMLDFYCYATANIGQNFFLGGGQIVKWKHLIDATKGR